MHKNTVLLIFSLSPIRHNLPESGLQSCVEWAHTIGPGVASAAELESCLFD